MLIMMLISLSTAHASDCCSVQLPAPAFIEAWKESLHRYDRIHQKRTEPLRTQFPQAMQKIQDTTVNYFRKNDITIPRHIHYIWIGGPMPEKYWRGIVDLHFIAQDNDCQLTLWVDDKKNLRKLKTPEGFYKKNLFFECFRETHVNLNVRNISELQNTQDADLLLPTGFLKELWYWIDLEQIGLTNLAAAADLLRYLILSVHGGIYIDADDQVISKHFDTKNGHVYRLLETLPARYGFHISYRGNAFIAASPKHPILLLTLLHTIAQYHTYMQQHDYDLPWVDPQTQRSAPQAYLSDMDRKRRPYAPHPQESRKKLQFTYHASCYPSIEKTIQMVVSQIRKHDPDFPGLKLQHTPFFWWRSPPISGKSIPEQMERFLADMRQNAITAHHNFSCQDFVNLVVYHYNFLPPTPKSYQDVEKLLRTHETEIREFVNSFVFRTYSKSQRYSVIKLGKCYFRYVSDANWLSSKKIPYVVDTRTELPPG